MVAVTGAKGLTQESLPTNYKPLFGDSEMNSNGIETTRPVKWDEMAKCFVKNTS